jgi:hypothetical protein
MLPYEDGKKLEKLLERLFGDDESTPEDVVVLRGPIPPIKPFACCSNSYGSYGGE